MNERNAIDCEANGDIVVGVSEMAVSTDRTERLVTYSLGSCIGLSLFDPVAGVGGLLHAMLPVSSLNPQKAAEQPQMFTDTGVSALLAALFELGARRQDLIAVAAGGASSMDPHGMFRIGERNHMVLRKLLWKNQILIAAEDMGGTVSRTMYLDMASGRTLVKSDGRVRVLEPTTGG